MQVRVSQEINTLLDAAAEISVRKQHYFVGVEHVYDAILEASTLLPKTFVDRYTNELQSVSRELGRAQWQGGPASEGEVFYTARCAEAISSAARYADRYRKGGLGGGHLLLAILADAYSAPSRILDRLGMQRGEMIACLRAELAAISEVRETAAPPTPVPSTATPLPREKKDDSLLESLTRDLTELARKGKLEHAVGRDSEMFQILEVLSRKNKNNVMLIGEAGVGKTHIVEGLAQAAVCGGENGLLAGYRFLELSMSALMGGTQYRGALEQKLGALLDELRRSPNIVLFIDEVHLIMGAGSTDGDGIDIANLLKPALARGEIRCIGATTLKEYRKFVEKDPAIERRFQMVRVDALTEDATREVLRRIQPSLEKHHGVAISSRAIEAAITLTQRYMPNRHLPDKAIDTLDQACARFRLKRIALMREASRAKGDARDTAATLVATMPNKVTPHDVRKVISQSTGIPVNEMTSQERLLLTDLDRLLKARIIGQDEAVERAVATVKKARVGLASPNRPDAVMLFVGPTGVGKTELAKALAETLFGSTSHLVTFDMSEYTEAHSVSRLIGAPPGYVGYEEEGALFQAMRSTPFAILLFDEIEKAHRRIFDIFLPIFDEGRLKDSRGREVSFRECTIILTSNIGAELLTGKTTGDTQKGLIEALRANFRPEFINRIDEIVPFHPLLFEDIRAILKLRIDDLAERLREKRIGVHVYHGAYEHLAEQGYSASFGARELRRAVERLVVEPISDRILRGEFVKGDMIDVLMEGGKMEFRKAATSKVEEPTSGADKFSDKADKRGIHE